MAKTTTFKPRFDGYADRVSASLQSQPLMSELLDAKANVIEPGRVDISLVTTPQMLQPHGNVHGVIASALADSAAGYAAQTLLPEGADIVTVEYKINFLAPGVGTVIRAHGEVIRAGRTLFVCHADVFAEQAAQETHFAHMVATMMSVTVD